MSTVLTFALLGLAGGAAYAVAAFGIVVVYRGSGVVNFAHVGMAMVGAFTYDGLRRAGWPQAAAVVAGVAAACADGLATHALVMQRMQRASTLVRVVATLGLLTVLESAAGLIYGDGTLRLVPPLLPSQRVHIGSAVVAADRLWLAVISAALGGGLWAIYRFTRFGQLTTAVAQSQRAVAALGRSPQRIAMLNWIIGGGLAGLAGILLVPVVGLSVPTLAALLVPALAAALVGGFSSFGLTWLGAIAIGIGQSEVTRYITAPGWASALPIVVVIVILVLRGRALPERGEIQARLPAVGSGAMRPAVVVVSCAVVALLVSVLGSEWVDAITVAATTGMVCVSMIVVTGYAGQLSLAQFAIAGLGALLAARASVVWGLSFWLAAVFAIAATTCVGLVFALPALRTRGVTLGIVTLGLAVVVEQAILGNPSYTGGFLGTTVKPPHLAGLSLDGSAHPTRYALLCIVCLALASLLVSNVRRGTLGRRLLAVRANERAAASLGLNIVALKLIAFSLAAAIAAVSGVLIAFKTQSVVFDGFTTQQSINLLGVTVIGGIGYIGGAMFGAVGTPDGPVSTAIGHVTSSPDVLGLITGAGLILVLLTAPNGVFPVEAARWRRWIGRVVPTFARRALHRRGEPEGQRLASQPVRRAVPHVLAAEDLSVSFGGTRALDSVSLEFGPGEVIGVIGPNGAGKTTLIDVLTGLTRPDQGSVTLDGVEISRLSVAARARRGIVRSYQSLELFEDLSVIDNLRVPSETQGRLGAMSDLLRPREAPLAAAAVAAVHELALEPVLERRPDELSYGQRRLVAIARALAAAPSVLLLDEPAAGLDEEERGELARLLPRLADEWGLAVLVVEHDVALVAAACDRVMALDFGLEIARGTAQDVLGDEAVVRAYLGGEGEPRDGALA
jgi:ABC-type branched-subunit amino acid transport system ATPase component/ABC-type branched-subunit amino acid transport system permease subunit